MKPGLGAGADAGAMATWGIGPRLGLSGTHGSGDSLQRERGQAELTNLVFQGGSG